MTDVVQSSTSLPYNCITESIIIYEVQSNHPTRYTISPSYGLLHSNQTSLITVELIICEMGLVRFLSTVPGDYFLLDQIVVLTAATFCELPGAEKQEAFWSTSSSTAVTLG
jgi:hypothetical protein